MPQLIFGCVFLVFALILVLAFYAGSGDVTVMGEVYSHEEFQAMLLPKLILGLFILLGLFLIVLAIVKMIKKGAVKRKGLLTYGLIVDLQEAIPTYGGLHSDLSNKNYTGAYGERRRFQRHYERSDLIASILVINDAGELKSYQENIGFNISGTLNVNDFLSIKYHEGQIAIVGKAGPYEIPPEAKERLEANRGNFGLV